MESQKQIMKYFVRNRGHLTDEKCTFSTEQNSSLADLFLIKAISKL